MWINAIKRGMAGPSLMNLETISDISDAHRIGYTLLTPRPSRVYGGLPFEIEGHHRDRIVRAMANGATMLDLVGEAVP